jgi:hypothetical protein
VGGLLIVLVCACILILALIVSLIVAIGRLACWSVVRPELSGYVQDVGAWLAKAGVGDQIAAATDAADAAGWPDRDQRAVSTLAILSDLFFLVALPLFWRSTQPR